MKWFYDLNIAHKLNAAFLLVLVFIVGLGGFSIAQLAQVNKSSTDIARNWLPSINSLSKISLALARSRSFDMQQLLTDDKKEEIATRERANKQMDSLLKELAAYGKLISQPREKELYPEIERNIAQYREVHLRMNALFEQGQKPAGHALMNSSSTPVYRKLQDNINELSAVNAKGAEVSDAEANRIYRESRLAIVCLLAVCIVLAMVLSWWIARLVARPLIRAVSIARQVAKGDLTSQIPYAGRDETGQLMDALKQMNGNLLHIVREVRMGTDTITTASAEIATGNMDLSMRTEQQASALEETASSMEELTSTVKQNGDNVRQANEFARSATDIARQGAAAVADVVATMAAINTSSNKIVDIISVIDGIAFQTNILALNAAVEAARAGEQGRGFAVVASEVRTLAQRSAAAAKEIKTLIGDSLDKVKIGNELVSNAGSTMAQVVSGIERVTDIMSEITSAGREQEAGIEQINQAVTEMDAVTQQNAALVEEAAAAAAALEEQAAQLAKVVSVFKLDDSGAQPSVSASASRERGALAQADSVARLVKLQNFPQRHCAA